MDIKISDGPGEAEIITKVGSITRPAEMQGRLLEIELDQVLTDFVHYMDLAGLTLWRGDLQGMRNPDWVRWTPQDCRPGAIVGEAKAWFAMDFDNTNLPIYMNDDGTPRLDEHGQTITLPRTRERSLEDSGGMVEYRCVGAFWANPMLTEIEVDRDEILANERRARNPTVFGPGPATR